MDFYKREKYGKLVVYTLINNKEKIIKKYNLNERRKAERYLKSLDPNHPDIKKITIGKGITINEAIEAYIKTIDRDRINTRKCNTNYIGYLNSHILPRINKTYLSDYTVADFKFDFIPKLMAATNKKGDLLSRSVIIEIKGLFQRFFRFCDDNNWECDLRILTYKFTKNAIQRPPKDQYAPYPNDIKDMLLAEPNIKYQALIYFAAETGARPNEILGALWSDIDWKNKILFIKNSIDDKGKLRLDFLKNTGSRRKIVISDKLLKLLEVSSIYKKDRIFPYTLKKAKGIIRRAAKRANVNWIGGLKPFRKFNYTLLKNKGIYSAKGLANRIGHNNTMTGALYYEVELDEQRKNQKLLNQLME